MDESQPLDSTFAVLPFIQAPLPPLLQYTVARIQVHRLFRELPRSTRRLNPLFCAKFPED